jgi:hypothetical protein
MNYLYITTKGIGLMPRTKVETEVTTKVVTSVTTTQVALDATNASELLVKLDSVKDTIKTNQDQEKALKAELYALLGYELVKATTKDDKDEWVGTAEAGTIGGNVVVRVATINATKLDKENLFKTHPQVKGFLETFTIPAPYKALKTGK